MNWDEMSDEEKLRNYKLSEFLGRRAEQVLHERGEVWLREDEEEYQRLLQKKKAMYYVADVCDERELESFGIVRDDEEEGGELVCVYEHDSQFANEAELERLNDLGFLRRRLTGRL